ncbi:hypothetical protein CODIS_36770 [Candidatus Thiodiazotropha endolucinida]|uniref:Uncharacterized protein n=1 Tax=Candidatus Thiodiazotropha endolucinida TaxID=1655433 RepID=A0A7Z1ADR3_9GAMM|nr:hypothetical protein CODIS_36770 [Candidatus Thiodiazotropha endolucinida]
MVTGEPRGGKAANGVNGKQVRDLHCPRNGKQIKTPHYATVITLHVHGKAPVSGDPTSL